ncbi:MAG: GlsB/YeaQ/YmgE family stress response membrane protein [Candidatus Izemoplasmataceae bacterium]
MGFLSWIAFGGLAGWLASKLTGDDEHMGLIENIAVGLVGAFLGGYIATRLGMGTISGFNLQSFIIAVIGATVFLVILGWLQRH